MNFNDNKTLQDFVNAKPEIKGVKKIILVAATKGGVGKSTLACNLAVFLAQQGQKIALVDSDIYGPSVAHLFDIQAKPDIKDDMFIPLVKHNVKIMSIANIIEPDQSGVWRGPMVTKILFQLIRAVNWTFDKQNVDVMIIDMPPGTGDVYISIGEKFPVNGVVLVSSPQSLAIIDLVKSLDCFNKLKIPILGIVQNMAYYHENNQKKYLFGQDGAKNFATKNHLNFFGEIPIDPLISQHCEQQNPFILELLKNNNNNEVLNCFDNIKEKIINS